MASVTIGERVTYERERRDLSRVALAVKAGIHPNTVQRIESAGRVPTLDTLTRIAIALGMDPQDLLP